MIQVGRLEDLQHTVTVRDPTLLKILLLLRYSTV
jgi:hypothetical protein